MNIPLSSYLGALSQVPGWLFTSLLLPPVQDGSDHDSFGESSRTSFTECSSFFIECVFRKWQDDQRGSCTIIAVDHVLRCRVTENAIMRCMSCRGHFQTRQHARQASTTRENGRHVPRSGMQLLQHGSNSWMIFADLTLHLLIRSGRGSIFSDWMSQSGPLVSRVSCSVKMLTMMASEMPQSDCGVSLWDVEIVRTFGLDVKVAIQPAFGHSEIVT